MVLRVVELWGDLRHVPPMPGLRRMGVPPGGAFDAEAAGLASALVDAPLEGLVELAFGRATFVCEEVGMLAAVEGASGFRRWVAAGARVEIAPARSARVVLAGAGGFTLPPLGADPEVSFRLGVGSLLGAASARHSDARLPARAPDPEVVFVEPGPDRSLWTEPMPELRVGASLDRRGVRLDGGPKHPFELPSAPCVAGAVQWTPSGELIVLGPDGPTVGGYPKPFVVLASSMPIVARLRPGEEVRFAEIPQEEARKRDARWRRELEGRHTMLRMNRS